MSVYVDDWGVHNARATITVEEETKSAKITYKGTKGATFRVKVYQKPNPIGFRARLPGQKK